MDFQPAMGSHQVGWENQPKKLPKNVLETKNNHLDKNAGITLNGHKFKRLLERLKSLLETANERAGLKNIKNFDGHNIKNAENIIDTSEIGDLKKQISKQ